MKQSEPCRAFTSEDPGAGSHWPDPCATCGWSQPEHEMYWHEHDLKNDILLAVNKALDGTGLSIARGTVNGEDTYQVVRLPTLVEAPQIDLSNHHNALACPYCNPKGLKLAETPLVDLTAFADRLWYRWQGEKLGTGSDLVAYQRAVAGELRDMR